MERKLMAWALAVKARQRHLARARRLPVLWLFTDALRLPDPLGAVNRLPRCPGLCGVVLRHDGEAGRTALGLALAALCRARGMALVVAGDARLAARLGAGLHARGGRMPARRRPGRLATSSAHTLPELLRARRNGAALAFLSPFAATRSHPGERPLGPVRWAALARRAGMPVAALGGVAGRGMRALPQPFCVGIGAISALS